MNIKEKSNIVLFSTKTNNYLFDLSKIKSITNARYNNAGAGGYGFTIFYKDKDMNYDNIIYSFTNAITADMKLEIIQKDVDYLLSKIQEYYKITRYESQNPTK